MTSPASIVSSRLSGSRVLVLNWRDVRHPQAGGAEHYMHQIGRRWAQAGVDVTWFTARPSGQPALEELDGMHVQRFGGPLSLYPRAAVRMLRSRRDFDAVVDCQNGIPFFSPLFVGRNVPVVQLVHHVHQDQFATRFSAPMTVLGRTLEGPVARRVYRRRAIAAVSPSTRSELRRRLGFQGPIFVVPNGTIPVSDPPEGRSSRPTIAVVARLVPHKRIEILLGQLPLVVAAVPDLRVEVIGDGPERARLQGLVADLALQSTVTFHGRLSDDARDQILRRAWLTTSTSAGEGWGCTVLEAAAWGVPCLALHVPGICDSVIDGRTGWLVDEVPALGPALVDALVELADEDGAARMAAACQEWARCFTWDRSAELLAGVLLDEIGLTTSSTTRPPQRRHARSDIAVLAQFPRPETLDLRVALRATDEVTVDGDRALVVLSGCDEFDAAVVLQRLGARDVSLSLVDRRDLLAGPGALVTRETPRIGCASAESA